MRAGPFLAELDIAPWTVSKDLQTALGFQGAMRERGLLFSAHPPLPNAVAVKELEAEEALEARCSCDVFPLDVFPVNRN